MLIYLTADQIASTSLVTDNTGTLLSQVHYAPYGRLRWTGTGSLGTDRTYTGQRDDGFGLLDYNARYYDPALGRFASPDSLIPDPNNPLAWDRYTYVKNNPVNFNDPTGHRPCNAYCSGESIDGREIMFGSSYAGEWDTKKQKERSNLLDKVIVGGSTTIASVVSEPLDWAMTGYDCINGDCSPFALLGLLPFIPGSVGNHADDALDAISALARNSNEAEAFHDIDQIANDVVDWVGEGSEVRVVINENDDLILRNVDNTKKFRADFNDPSPHSFPHMHLEWINEVGEWIGKRIWPIDVPHK